MKQIGNMNNLNYIKIRNMPIGIYKDGPVGIGISGGADSAVLLYILMSYVDKPIHVYNMWSSSRKYSFAKSVDAVIETCSRFTGNTNYVVHKTQVEPKETNEFFFNMLTDALNKQEVDMVYMAVTNFPPKEVYLEFDQQQEDWHNRFRSDEVVHPLFGLTISGELDNPLVLDERVYVPLRNYNKKAVVELYRALNLEHNLLPVTRSCEDDDHRDSHCGKCWWCQERLWAFGHL
jgi:hypothetical protein